MQQLQLFYREDKSELEWCTFLHGFKFNRLIQSTHTHSIHKSFGKDSLIYFCSFLLISGCCMWPWENWEWKNTTANAWKWDKYLNLGIIMFKSQLAFLLFGHLSGSAFLGQVLIQTVRPLLCRSIKTNHSEKLNWGETTKKRNKVNVITSNDNLRI